MYVILTTKPGLFRTEADAALHPVESYDYLFYGKRKACFTIARLDRPSKVRVIEDEPPHIVNEVPTKFLESFDTIEGARAELHHLTHFGSIDARLVRHDLGSA